MRTVSFQPRSLSSGGVLTGPVVLSGSVDTHLMRFTIWTLTRWKWMAWVSTPLWVMRQICVSPSAMFSVDGSM